MPERSQQVSTLCLQTEDAIETSPGTFEFKPKWGDVGRHFMRVSIASIEFPVSQYNIENIHNRVYIHESSITPSLELTLEHKSIKYTIDIPPTLNPIVTNQTRSSNRVKVQFEYPHHDLLCELEDVFEDKIKI